MRPTRLGLAGLGQRGGAEAAPLEALRAAPQLHRVGVLRQTPGARDAFGGGGLGGGGEAGVGKLGGLLWLCVSCSSFLYCYCCFIFFGGGGLAAKGGITSSVTGVKLQFLAYQGECSPVVRKRQTGRAW